MCPLCNNKLIKKKKPGGLLAIKTQFITFPYMIYKSYDFFSLIGAERALEKGIPCPHGM